MNMKTFRELESKEGTLLEKTKEFWLKTKNDDLVIDYLLMYGVSRKFAESKLEKAKTEVREEKLKELLGE